MKYFTSFIADIDSFELPDKFNYPFNYTPEPIAEQAARELQAYIESEIEPIHNFGLNNESDGIGKMFGVLVVKNALGAIGYLSAFSGKLGMRNDYDRFVPPVYDMLNSQGFYKSEEEKINQLSAEIWALEESEDYHMCLKSYQNAVESSTVEIAKFKEKKKEAKFIREHKRKEAECIHNELERLNFLHTLDRQSAQMHYDLKHLIKYWKDVIGDLKNKIDLHEGQIKNAKTRRKEMSIALQHRLFENYSFLNARKVSKSLHAIFPIDAGELPPSGAGECAAPKLLHYAYANNLKPICMAEFWYGRSPSSEIRKHGYFYPACKTKCLPILTHMLDGLEVECNPLEDNPMKVAHLDIIFDDADIVVVNKPHDFLSVPGKNIIDSVFTRLQIHYPEIKDLMVVHRLDMSTSGLILFAKNKAAHKHIQMQFLHKTIHKRYSAILDGEIHSKTGNIDLPIAVDYENRPRQKISYEMGKPALTRYEVIKVENQKTLIHFYPVTGRTHQLRVHAAHHNGLNTPIVGDDLYGKRADRLYLHAEELSFIHPTTCQRIKLEVQSDFESL